MRESRGSSPEEVKIAKVRNLYENLDMSWSEDNINFEEENIILRNNVKELQEQLQTAYKRIAELTLEMNYTNQMELEL